MSQLPPGATLSKACSRCHKKKTKCDGRLPRCSPCVAAKGGGADCDVRQCISYTATYVEALQAELTAARARVAWLERAMDESTGSRVAEIETGGFPFGPPSKRARLTTFQSAMRSSDSDVEKLVSEVGMLALRAGNGAAPYLGSASGIAMARILAQAIPLDSTDPDPSLDLPQDLPTPRMSAIHAGVPPLETAQYLLQLYLDRVHVLHPLVDLSVLERAFAHFYPAPTDPPSAFSNPPTNFSRFLFSMVLAIGASEARGLGDTGAADDAPPRPHPLWTPEEYCNSATSFVPQLAAKVDLEALVMAALLCVYGMRNPHARGVNIWHYSTFSMALAIELGLPRYCTQQTADWPFQATEAEYRRRLWWTVYALERTVAVRLGRSLTLREQAVDAAWPLVLGEVRPPSRILPDGVAVSYAPAMHNVRLCRIAGMALETVYAARSGKKTILAEETERHVSILQSALVEWMQALPQNAQLGTLAFDTLTFNLYQISLLVHRPSPSFPSPTPHAHEHCLSVSRKAIQLAARMIEAGHLALTRASVFDIFMNGLVLLHSSRVSPTSTESARSSADPDLSSCLSTLTTLSTRLELGPSHAALFQRCLAAFDRASAPAPPTVPAASSHLPPLPVPPTPQSNYASLAAAAAAVGFAFPPGPGPAGALPLVETPTPPAQALGLGNTPGSSSGLRSGQGQGFSPDLQLQAFWDEADLALSNATWMTELDPTFEELLGGVLAP
ncbi:hypothetical protein JCM10207_008904 [Rhodosporidiobolus poonsookiae]